MSIRPMDIGAILPVVTGGIKRLVGRLGQHSLGYCLFNGHGVSQNAPQAVPWVRKALPFRYDHIFQSAGQPLVGKTAGFYRTIGSHHVYGEVYRNLAGTRF